MYVKCNSNKQFSGPIIPTEVSLFYEDGMPYLKYTGTTLVAGRKAKIHFHKIGLAFDQMESICDRDYAVDSISGARLLTLDYAQRLYAKDSQYFDYEFIPQEVTLDELEKMLGYPVVIKESK